MFFASAAVALLALIAPAVRADEVSDALSATPTATIAPGRIIGTTTSIAGPTGSVAVNKFLGIPFAKPPIGQARFSTPQAPAPWTTDLKTQDFGPSCIQSFAPSSFRAFTESVFNNPPPRSENEDCLYLNVFAPKKAWDPKAPPYPVLFWMYGGAWQFGTAALPMYDGSHFAALEDVILVSVNYRTNVFGFPDSAAVANLTARNLALLDQRAGLNWVQDNIHHFGGDKSRVTIFGESAGGFAVDVLISSFAKGAPRPFRAGIMESGTYAYIFLGNCTTDTFDAWNNLSAALGCTGTDQAKFDCIKNTKSAAQIKAAEEQYGLRFGHTCDNNVTYVSDPRNRLEKNQVADVPVILGTNTADGSFYTIIYSNASGTNTNKYFDDQFFFFTADQRAKLRDAALVEYKAITDPADQLAQIHTDWFFHCPHVWYGETSTKFKPTYRYLYNAEFANTRAQAPAWPARYQGAYHSSEIPLVFTSYNASTAEAGEDALSNAMRGAWASFARDPTKPPISNWPVVGQGVNGADVMEFGTDKKGAFAPIKDPHHCDFWRNQGFREFHA